MGLPNRLTLAMFVLDIETEMDVEQTIVEIEHLELIFAVPHVRPLSPSDLAALNRRHDELLAHNPSFRLFRREFGVCCDLKLKADPRL